MHEVWDFDSDWITCEVHSTVQLDVGAGVVGQFSSNCLTENGRRIPILGKNFISGSVEYLVIPESQSTGGPMWAENFLAPRSSWGDGGTNHNWGVRTGGPYINVVMAWGTTIPYRPDYQTLSLERPHIAARRVRDDFHCARHCEHDRIFSRSCNHVVNPRVNWHGDDWEGPVDQ